MVSLKSGKPRLGMYVIPDNKSSGVLDSILVKCAPITYPNYMSGAKHFIDGIDETRKKSWKPFDAEKALVACIVSVLRPGMANTPSIAQDSWICADTLNNVNEVTQLSKFLVELLELPTALSQTS